MATIGQIEVSRKPPKPKSVPKPKKPKLPKNPKAYLFRYFSNRGTDHRICVLLKGDTTDKDALELAKDWAERETLGTACYEYTVTIARVKTIPRAQWLKKWDKLCKRKRNADEAYSNHRAIGNPFDWSTAEGQELRRRLKR